ncbi:hypothetical protein [Sphingorhabdus contaminans]|uniref:Uncharacterized protein n=1 Tax=Sphingorhabdus contaminans TaxID=1343899 RepID=A0A553WAP7_9SPHN|nr:hypothetical protein [Sphingorhabdus contaminans]TSB01743.1 hypothetical protein FOM92_11245 [Sphingorhabdus contaminans]
MNDSQTNRIGLTQRQTLLLVATGAALWFVAAVLLRIIAPMGALEGTMRGVSYALVIPGTLPFVFLTRWIARLRDDQMGIGIALATMTALLIDGIVVAWFPAVYGGHLPQVTNCAAIILWGAGVAILLGFFMNKGALK